MMSLSIATRLKSVARFAGRIRLTIGILLALSSSGHAESCPWLNAATAGGALGGEVSTELIHTNSDDLKCEFIRKDGGSLYTLVITVHTMTDPIKEFEAHHSLCRSSETTLRGVGNEAIECIIAEDHDRATTQVIGRVRDRIFVLRMSMPKADAGSPTHSDEGAIQDIVQNLAEQVAGSLF